MGNHTDTKGGDMGEFGSEDAKVGGLPPQVISHPFGVNVHFVEPDSTEVEVLASAGFKFIRMDFQWSVVEKEKGVYNFTGYEHLLSALDEKGIRALLIFDYGNPFYDNGLAPHSDEGRCAFAKFAGKAAAHFQDRGVLWEIWNEPNGTGFWKPKPNPEHYTALAIRTADAIKEADPEALVVAPAISMIDLEFLEASCQFGLLEHIDVVSVHPYRSKPPETVSSAYSALQDVIARYAPREKSIPLISGEWGYSAVKVSLEQQAQYLVRQMLSNMLIGFQLSIWYDWRNDGTDPNEKEHNFGTVFNDLSPKPAYRAMKVLVEQLDRYRLVERIDTGDTSDYVLLFRKGGTEKVVAWTIDEGHQIRLALNGGKAEITDMMGQARHESLAGGYLTLKINGSPVYITT